MRMPSHKSRLELMVFFLCRRAGTTTLNTKRTRSLNLLSCRGCGDSCGLGARGGRGADSGRHAARRRQVLADDAIEFIGAPRNNPSCSKHDMPLAAARNQWPYRKAVRMGAIYSLTGNRTWTTSRRRGVERCLQSPPSNGAQDPKRVGGLWGFGAQGPKNSNQALPEAEVPTGRCDAGPRLGFTAGRGGGDTGDGGGGGGG